MSECTPAGEAMVVKAVASAAAAVALAVAAAIMALAGPAGPAYADPVQVFPGMEIHQDTHVCTLGYVNTVTRVGYTAGHCRGGGTVTDAAGSVIGTMTSFQDNTPAGTTVSTDQVIADYEVISLADDVNVSDVLPDGRRLESGPVLLAPGQPVCHFGVATGESCGMVEKVNNGWFTMTRGVVTQHGDSGGPVYATGAFGAAQIVGLFTSVWGDLPAAVSWSAIVG